MDGSTKSDMVEDSHNGSISDHKLHDVEKQGDMKGRGGNESQIDPNLVDFDGPDDPENPLNWPASKKNLSISLMSLITLLS